MRNRALLGGRRTALVCHVPVLIFKFRAVGQDRELCLEEDVLDCLAGESGREPRDITIASEHWLSIARDAEAAYSRAARTMQGMEGHPYSDQQVESRRQGVTGGYHLFGAPSEIAGQAAAYRDAGVDHLVLRVIGRDRQELMDSLGLFKEGVMDPLHKGAS